MEKPLVMTAMVGDSGSVLLKTAVGFLQSKGKELTVRPKKTNTLSINHVIYSYYIIISYYDKLIDNAKYF